MHSLSLWERRVRGKRVALLSRPVGDANDLDAPLSLIAVSLGSNRPKGDKDPAEWMSLAKDDICTYAVDWVASKLRWKLTADRAALKALHVLAGGCRGARVNFTPAR
ncbi:hypothetical protein AB0D83_27935 [Streptomyces decoyicus]|uniref:hypothetical protein n=1 Tax=Streptomyces decoyicus TaxID=249567 RepID=UPI0033E4C70B